MNKTVFPSLLLLILAYAMQNVDMAALVARHHINERYYYTTYSPYNFSEENLAKYRPYIDKPTHPIRPKKDWSNTSGVDGHSESDEFTVVKQTRGRSIFVLQKGVEFALSVDRLSMELSLSSHFHIRALP